MKSAVETDYVDAIVTALGGKRIDTLSVNRAELHADYLFADHRTIVELKELETDQINAPAFVKKASSLYLDARKADATKVILFGTRHLKSNMFNAEFEARFHSLYRVPIERLVRKADAQIANTARALNVLDPRGLLLMVNTNHTAITPGHLPYLFETIFQGDQYPHINELIYITLNLPAVTKNGYEFDTWFRFQPNGREPVSTILEKRIRRRWQEMVGYESNHVQRAGFGSIFDADNVR